MPECFTGPKSAITAIDLFALPEFWANQPSKRIWCSFSNKPGWFFIIRICFIQ